MDLGVRDRACIITGASRGIGRQTALMLAGEGAAVLLTARDQDALERVAGECRQAGGEAAILALDIVDADAGERLLAACLQRFDRVDALVNNAGTSRVRSLEQLTDEDWQEQWELHVMAPMRLMRAAAPAMARRGWGRIVNVSSSSGKRPGQRNVAYSVTKAAELSLSRAFADRYAGDGVLINSITPGPVGTGLWLDPGGLADQVAEAQGKTRDQVLEGVVGGVPLGRLGTEQEMAAVICFLCSERASYVTGAAWSVDGGTVPVIL
jgi:NAD(P)-dependent dehydrogenase (short-subunit alcohol dehydrogenase family)